jgi:hypothetical protein
MSKREKLLNQLLSNPRDFTWDELVVLLSQYGYSEIKKSKTGGSRRKFVDKAKNIIALHKPHPANTVKEYVIREVIIHLKEKGHIKDE